MKARAMTPEQLNESGMEALRERLGVAGMLRFLQQHQPGWGDYSKDRHAWLDDITLEDWAERLAAARQEKEGTTDDQAQDGPAPRYGKNIEWRGLTPLRGKGRGVLASAFIRAAYAAGDPGHDAGSWEMESSGNAYRLDLVSGWIAELAESYELSILLLPAGFFIRRRGHGWTLDQVKQKVAKLAAAHGVTIVVGFDDLVDSPPDGLDRDWPHQYILFARPGLPCEHAEKQWFLGEVAWPSPPSAPQPREWQWNELRIGGAVCHDLKGLGRRHPEGPMFQNQVDLILNPRHVNSIRPDRPRDFGYIGKSLQKLAGDFKASVAVSMMFRDVSENSAAQKFAYRFQARRGVNPWVRQAKPTLHDVDNNQTLAWFQILDLP